MSDHYAVDFGRDIAEITRQDLHDCSWDLWEYSYVHVAENHCHFHILSFINTLYRWRSRYLANLCVHTKSEMSYHYVA